MENEIKILKKYFTLIELIAAMGVFTIIMLVMLTFFSSAQKAWTNCINRGQIYENARIAMDLISRDLQCAYYEKDKVPFWHKAYTDYAAQNAVYNQEALCFVSVTNIVPDGCNSKICEVKYQLYNYDDTNGDAKCEGWLLRSATGDGPYTGTTPNSKWNYNNVFSVSMNGSPTATTNVFTADSHSSESYQKVIPYVTSLTFSCLTRDGTTPIPPDYNGNGSNPYKMTFPYSVRIELSLMDQQSWLKWKAMGGRQYIGVGGAVVQGTAVANDFRRSNERTFVKTVILGERGQN